MKTIIYFLQKALDTGFTSEEVLKLNEVSSNACSSVYPFTAEENNTFCFGFVPASLMDQSDFKEEFLSGCLHHMMNQGKGTVMTSLTEDVVILLVANLDDIPRCERIFHIALNNMGMPIEYAAKVASEVYPYCPNITDNTSELTSTIDGMERILGQYLDILEEQRHEMAQPSSSAESEDVRDMDLEYLDQDIELITKIQDTISMTRSILNPSQEKIFVLNGFEDGQTHHLAVVRNYNADFDEIFEQAEADWDPKNKENNNTYFSFVFGRLRAAGYIINELPFSQLLI